MSMPDNDRAVVGSNQAPEYARRVTDQMARDYAASEEALTALLDKARALPKLVENDEDALRAGAVIKEFRDLDRRLEAFRVAEKEPHLRAGDAVDQFFFALRDKIGKRKKNDRSLKPGAADILEDRNSDYMNRKLAAEQAERDRIAREEARKAREAREAQDRADREAEERRLAAERARKPEAIEQKSVAAAQAEETAAIAAATATHAVDRAEEARIATLAKPADMVRTRGDDGVLLTMAQEPYALVVDDSKLDMAKLWPFIKLDAKEAALRSWARTTGYTVPMAGAEIGHKNKSVTR